MGTATKAGIEPIGSRQRVAESNVIVIQSVWKGLFSVGAAHSLLDSSAPKYCCRVVCIV